MQSMTSLKNYHFLPISNHLLGFHDWYCVHRWNSSCLKNIFWLFFYTIIQLVDSIKHWNFFSLKTFYLLNILNILHITCYNLCKQGYLRHFNSVVCVSFWQIKVNHLYTKLLYTGGYFRLVYIIFALLNLQAVLSSLDFFLNNT